MRLEHILQRVGRNLVLRDEALRAALLVGDDDRRAPRAAFGVELCDDSRMPRRELSVFPPPMPVEDGRERPFAGGGLGRGVGV